jgi:hypothetical protein
MAKGVQIPIRTADGLSYGGGGDWPECFDVACRSETI